MRPCTTKPHRHRRDYNLPVAVVVLGAFLTHAAMAQTRDENLAKCKNPNILLGVEEACTALIESGKEPPEIIAIAHLHRGMATGTESPEDRQKAIADLEEAMRLKPATLTLEEKEEYFQGYLQLASDHIFGPDVIPALSGALLLKPDDFDTRLQRADEYQHSKQYDKAIADYNEDIRLRPDSSMAYCNRGYAYLQEAAQNKIWSENYKTRPVPFRNAADAATAASEASNALVEFPKALADLSMAIKLVGHDVGREHAINDDARRCHFIRAQAYMYTGEYDKAAADYDEVIKYDAAASPKQRRGSFNASNYINRAEAYYGNKQYDKALADLNEAEHLNPNDPMDSTIHHDFGNVYSKMKQYDKALGEYDIALGIAVGRGEETKSLYGGRSKVQYELGHYDKAIEDANKAVHDDGQPPMVEAYYIRGQAKIRKGDKAGGELDLATAKEFGFDESKQ